MDSNYTPTWIVKRSCEEDDVGLLEMAFRAAEEMQATRMASQARCLGLVVIRGVRAGCWGRDQGLSCQFQWDRQAHQAPTATNFSHVGAFGLDDAAIRRPYC